jgi:crotonobetainyl-CoA:carnitine CoA-transferase CaiB-like acyl-CoA transferase
MSAQSGTAKSASHEFPYRGLRVLDLGQGVASPYCAMLLALYGADVVKVEPPGGDWSRGLGTRFAEGTQTAMSMTFNRGKRALQLDLKSAEGRAVLRRLALKADVLVEGFRPGVAARLGVGYDSLKDENPGLIFLSVSGFGQQGDYADRPCTDSAAQAFSGMVSLNAGADGVPHRIGALMCDVPTGLYAYHAVATALYARRDTGTGRWIDISLMNGGAAILGHKLAEYALAGGPPATINAPAGTYRTADGVISIALINEGQYQRLCTVLGRPELATDPRFDSFPNRGANEPALVALIAPILAAETSAAWLARLRAADIICDKVNSFSDWLADPHVQSAGATAPIAQPGVGAVPMPHTPGALPASEAALTPAPAPGQHSWEVLAQAGLSEAEIKALAVAGVIPPG